MGGGLGSVRWLSAVELADGEAVVATGEACCQSTFPT
jgi:hypothetical protein